MEKDIFYFKEGVVTNDIEHERQLAIKIIDKLQTENKKLYESLSDLIHLHNCEMEGLLSGMPTTEQWMEAVEKASNVLEGK